MVNLSVFCVLQEGHLKSVRFKGGPKSVRANQDGNTQNKSVRIVFKLFFLSLC